MATTVRKLLLSAGTFVLVLAGLEAGLRAAGFRHESVVQFGWPQPDQLARFVPDPELFWVMPAMPGFSTEEGFPSPGGRPIEVPKPAGTYRLLFLGDSCTWGGYPFEVERVLNERGALPGRTFEAVAMAVSGYSSHQGLALARRHGERLDGDAAFVYFGWNDHWRARGSIDREKRVAAPAEEGVLARARRSSRVLQLARYLGGGLRGADEPLDRPRVPLDHYRENLEAIEAHFRALGVPVVFLTAPTAYERLGVPPEPVENGLVGSAEEAVEQHRRYNDVVREVAAATGAPLLDLAARVEALPEIAPLFRRDGIHFTPAGMAWLGETIGSFVEERLLGG